jgi:signal peptidase II
MAAAAEDEPEPNSPAKTVAAGKRASVARALPRFGLAVAVITCLADQLSKLWILLVLDLRDRGAVTVAPFMDFVLTWNRGISYGLFQQDGWWGQWPLLAVTIVALILLGVWLVRAETRLTALSLGLIIGGAVGNFIDRLAYGAVADFVLLHLTTATFRFNWYVFNVADVAIVAGVIGILYETLRGPRAAKAP